MPILKPRAITLFYFFIISFKAAQVASAAKAIGVVWAKRIL
jgi:hypothetical protein